MTRKLIPDIVSNQNPIVLEPGVMVLEAVKVMTGQRVGAVMVVDQDRLVGIFSERDVMTRVVALERDPKSTRLDEVMTANPVTLAPDDSPQSALALMRARGFRHLPILENDRVVGIISIRDLYAAVQTELIEDINQRDAYLYDRGYGAGN